MSTEYLRRNLEVCKAVGANANAKAAIERLLAMKHKPVWMLAAMEGIRDRTEGLSKELAKWRNTAPDAPAYASQRTEQQADPWRQAVDEALIAHALDCTGPGDDPKEKVKELLEWAVTIATDPRVSDGMEQDQPPRYWVHRERSYSQRAKAIIAFNTCSGDLDDKLNAAWGAALAADKKGEV